MKKHLTTLAVLFLLAGMGTGVLAQELTLHGYVNTGLNAFVGDGTKANKDDVRMDPHAHYAEVKGYQMNLAGAFTAGNFGFDFLVRVEGEDYVTGNLGSAFFRYAYGYTNLLDNCLLLKAGVVSDTAWRTQGDLYYDEGEYLGILAQVQPVENLNFGAGVWWGKYHTTLTDIDIDLMPAALATALGLPSSETPHSDNNLFYTFGGAYTLPGVFGVQTSWFLDEYLDGGGLDALTGLGNGERKYGIDYGVVGINLLAVPKLSAALEVNFEYLGNLSHFGQITYVQTLAYDLSPLKFGLAAYEYTTQADKIDTTYGMASKTGTVDSKPSFVIHPWVSYAIGSFVPKLSLTYYKDVTPGYSAADYYGGSGDYNTGTPLYHDSKSQIFEVNPSILWNVTPTGAIDIGCAYYLQTEKDVGENVFKFYVDLVWYF
ncbi:MAG: hypothetical protein LBK40_07805 [Spirochaetaceae bacterium]|nr:hypothetical protein [Spirochaetaceae bacterium]